MLLFYKFLFLFFFFPFDFCFFFVIFILAGVSQHENKKLTSTEPSVHFKYNGVPQHSVDLTASCPRCLAAAAEKPGGNDGECVCTCVNVHRVHVSILFTFFFKSKSKWHCPVFVPWFLLYIMLYELKRKIYLICFVKFMHHTSNSNFSVIPHICLIGHKRNRIKSEYGSFNFHHSKTQWWHYSTQRKWMHHIVLRWSLSINKIIVLFVT